jgi:glyceraldehyde 3-phosphate dehydrogenase
MIPTSTGAARAIGLVLPELKGKLDGYAMRVPTPDVSVVDLAVQLKKPATDAAINEAVRKAAEGPLRGILQYVEEPLVSADFVGNPHSSIFDSPSTKVLEGSFAKVMAWYDNEMGYATRCADLAIRMGKK